MLNSETSGMKVMVHEYGSIAIIAVDAPHPHST